MKNKLANMFLVIFALCLISCAGHSGHQRPMMMVGGHPQGHNGHQGDHSVCHHQGSYRTGGSAQGVSYREEPAAQGMVGYPGTKQSNWKMGSMTHQRWYFDPKLNRAVRVGPATDYNPEDEKLQSLMKNSEVKDDFPREIEPGGKPVVRQVAGKHFEDRDLTRPVNGQ